MRRVKATLLAPISRQQGLAVLRAPERALGASRLRLLPKPPDSFRVIFDLAKPPVKARSASLRRTGERACALLSRPVNQQLRHAFAELTSAARANGQLMGTSMLSIDQVGCKRPYIWWNVRNLDSIFCALMFCCQRCPTAIYLAEYPEGAELSRSGLGSLLCALALCCPCRPTTSIP